MCTNTYEISANTYVTLTTKGPSEYVKCSPYKSYKLLNIHRKVFEPGIKTTVDTVLEN